jgi:ubiquinone biosynthesis protein UbiJ
MSGQRIRELLAELNRELQSTSDLDPETRELLQDLNEDLDRLTGNVAASTLHRAKQLESRFAASHPVAERVARELADILAKMGV